MVDRLKRSAESTLGVAKGYQQEQFVKQLRARRVRPHVAEYAPNPKWPNWLSDERSGEGFAISQRKRKLVEKVFGWAKQDWAVRQVKLRGRARIDWLFRLVATAHDLLRMRSWFRRSNSGVDVYLEAEKGVSRGSNKQHHSQ
jgi:hypothetical protein